MYVFFVCFTALPIFIMTLYATCRFGARTQHWFAMLSILIVAFFTVCDIRYGGVYKLHFISVLCICETVRLQTWNLSYTVWK